MQKKNLLLLGGSYGIGHAIARLRQLEDQVYVASRSRGQLDQLQVNHIPYDALNEDKALTGLPSTIDGFVYCPGSIQLKPFQRLSLEQFREEMEVNFFSMIKVLHHILPKMTEGSSMVFFSTVAVGRGMPFHTSIAAAKGAIEGFARSLAAEYAPKIRVNVIAPSLVDTPLAGRLLSNERKKEIMAERHPLKRVGTAEDIAQQAVFLLGDQSSWISGQVIGVDGGISSLNIG